MKFTPSRFFNGGSIEKALKDKPYKNSYPDPYRKPNL